MFQLRTPPAWNTPSSANVTIYVSRPIKFLDVKACIILLTAFNSETVCPRPQAITRRCFPLTSFRFPGGGSLLARFGLCLVLSGVHPCRAQSAGVAEYEVKAIFLYDFARFVDWPPGSLANDHSPILVCIVGSDPFGSALDSTVRGQRIDHREIAIRHTNNVDDLKTCHIAFLSRAVSKDLPGVLESLKGSSTLLVGDGQGFAERGGTIQLYIEDSSVHFPINIDAVQRAHLSISSNVLALAKIVHDGHPPRTN